MVKEMPIRIPNHSCGDSLDLATGSPTPQTPGIPRLNSCLPLRRLTSLLTACMPIEQQRSSSTPSIWPIADGAPAVAKIPHLHIGCSAPFVFTCPLLLFLSDVQRVAFLPLLSRLPFLPEHMADPSQACPCDKGVDVFLVALVEVFFIDDFSWPEL